eukprot:TRINITY_DN4893_c0_g1_i1.p1 TRINITY_DN4893_c0_g1~~TRINITY_DN4893_c0_g1_i1.p1  ORF type:complete len:563 (+),score=83.39 TRINITY_DN4893_c0_g1_i1:110-1798(+)
MQSSLPEVVRLQYARHLSVLATGLFFSTGQILKKQQAPFSPQNLHFQSQQNQSARQKTAVVLGAFGALLPLVANCKPAQQKIDDDDEDDDDDEEIPSGWGWNKEFEPYFHSNEHTRRWRETSDMGRDYMNKGLYGQAEYYLTIALEEARMGWGNYDGHVGTTLSNMGELYRLQQKYDRAEPLYKEALDVMEEVYGTHHVFYGEVTQVLGLFYAECKRFDESIKYLMMAFKIFKQNLGMAHEKTAQIQCRLAEVYRAMKDYEKSSDWFEGALESFERHGSHNQPTCLFVISRYCDLLLESGNLEDLPEMMQRMLNIADYNKSQHVEYLQRVLMDLVKQDEEMAREYMTKCLDLKMKHHPHVSTKVAGAMRQAAEFELLLKQQDLQKALKYAKQAARLHREEHTYHSQQARAASFNYEAMRENMRSDDVLIAALDYSKSLEVLAKVYEKTGDLQSTEKVLRKACSILTDRNIITIVKRFRAYDDAYSQSGASIRSTRVLRAEKVDKERKEMLLVCMEHLIKVLMNGPNANDAEVREEILRLRSELQSFVMREEIKQERLAGLPK